MIRQMDTEMGIITWDRVSENNSSLLREIGLDNVSPIAKATLRELNQAYNGNGNGNGTHDINPGDFGITEKQLKRFLLDKELPRIRVGMLHRLRMNNFILISRSVALLPPKGIKLGERIVRESVDETVEFIQDKIYPQCDRKTLEDLSSYMIVTFDYSDRNLKEVKKNTEKIMLKETKKLKKQLRNWHSTLQIEKKEGEIIITKKTSKNTLHKSVETLYSEISLRRKKICAIRDKMRSYRLYSPEIEQELSRMGEGLDAVKTLIS